MLVSVLPVPFSNAGRQRQYEAVLAALQAETEDAPATVLLGNLGAFTPIDADILLVRPSGLALIVLVPGGGHLTLPALATDTWHLDGQPLPGREGADNPFTHYQRQLPNVRAWVGNQLSFWETALLPCEGIALFEAPLTFGPEVETQLHRHTSAADFQLVSDATQLPARLRSLAAAEAAILTEEELLDWVDYLNKKPASQSKSAANLGLIDFIVNKLQQLWRWLGAEDIPADPPYGGPLPDLRLRDQQEQARLQQLRHELQAELHQQRQEAAAREAARTQELALLRQQLTQASLTTSERQAEQQAKAALEESLRTARTELATRNRELDTHIQQLGQLIGQLQAAPKELAPTTPVPSGAPASGRQPGPAASAATMQKLRPVAAPARPFRQLRQAERWGVVALVLAGAGAGTWGVVRWAHHPAPRPAATAAHGVAAEIFPEDHSGDSYVPDSLADPHVGTVGAVAAPTDSTNADANTADAKSAELIIQHPTLHIDSAVVVSKPTPLIQAPDSAAAGPSPAP